MLGPERHHMATFNGVVDEAIHELRAEAESGNLERRHHLASAVAAFETIGLLMRAQDAVNELFPQEEE